MYPVSVAATFVIEAVAGLACADSLGLDDVSDLQPSAEAPRVSPTPFVVTSPLAEAYETGVSGRCVSSCRATPLEEERYVAAHGAHDDFFLGSGKDGIPAILEPRFESVAQADEWLDPLEPVMLLELGSDVRAYPVQILVLHELVNDVVDGQPVLVSY